MNCSSPEMIYFDSFWKIVRSPGRDGMGLAIGLTKLEDGIYDLVVKSKIDIAEFIREYTKPGVSIKFERDTICDQLSLWPCMMAQCDEGLEDMEAMLEVVLFMSIQKLEEASRDNGLPTFNPRVKVRIADRSKKFLGKKKMLKIRKVYNPIAIDQ